MKYEIREFKPKVTGTGAAKKITGTPIVFNSRSKPLGGMGVRRFREIVAPGSVQFSDELRVDFAHDSKYILGSVSNGTLVIREDSAGVHMEATPPDTQWARDLAVSIERGDIEGGSFRFMVLQDGEKWTREGAEDIRTLTKILVDRVTVTSDPAYIATDVQVRSVVEVAAGIPNEDGVTPPARSGGEGLFLKRLELAEREIL